MGDAPAQPPTPPVADGSSDEEKAAQKAAADAKSKLRLFKVTATRKFRVPMPVVELHPGANHFEVGTAEDSKPLLARLAELAATKDITVEVLDGDGKPTAWPPKGP